MPRLKRFSMIGLLIGILLLVVVVVVPNLEVVTDTKCEQAQEEIKYVQKLAQEHLKRGKTVAELVANPLRLIDSQTELLPKDPWGEPYLFSIGGNGDLIIDSKRLRSQCASSL